VTTTPKPSTTEVAEEPRLAVRRVLLLACAFAVWTGIVELTPVFLASSAGASVRLSRHFMWMAPLGELVYFAFAAAILLVGARFEPRLRNRSVVTGAFAGLSAFALGLVLERLYTVAVLVLAVGVGVQVARMTRAPTRWPRAAPTMASLGVLLILGLVLRAGLVHRSWERTWLTWLPTPDADAPNVVLIILDTVRGASYRVLDDLRPQSEWPPTATPVFDGLAAEGVVFTRAIAPSPWTLPTHASVFTGRWPTELWNTSRLGAEWVQALDARYPTVAEVLARRGYLTAGFVANTVFASAETGLNRGFLHYHDYPVSLGQVLVTTSIGRRLESASMWRRVTGYHDLLNRRSASEVADQFLAWHERLGDRPYFAFVNLFDAHEPVFPPDSVRRALPEGSRWDEFDHFAGLLTGTGALRSEKWFMTDAERAAHAAGYDAGIRTVDDEVGRILGELDRRGDLERTLVLITSDHGEQLGEHGLYDHNNSLYLPALHVPLLVLDPATPEPAVVRQVVSLRDVAATLLERVGIDPAASGVPGRSLARWWTGQPTAPDTVFSTLSRGSDNQPWYPVSWGPVMYSLVDSAYHYVVNGDGSDELYDHRTDAAELVNLAWDPAMTDVVVDFRARLAALGIDLPARPTAPVAHPTPPAPPER
jgi:arylsulfatase A-like enzyme